MRSLNWKPPSDGSNLTHSTNDRIRKRRAVHSAVHLAFDASVSSSPRTIIIARQPTSGSHVISDRIGKPAALLTTFIGSPAQHEDTDQHHDADQHDEGIDRER